MSASSKQASVVTRGPLHQVADMAKLCAMGIKRSQLTRMAAALSYRTIFGLIPVLVVGLVFTATFAKEEQVRGWIESVLRFAGLSQIAVAPVDVGPQMPNAGRLDQWIGDMVNHVRGLKWELVGFVGLATLIYAAISMLVEIEEAFNQICNAPGGRSWTRRVTQYWTLLTLGSLFLIGSFSIPSQLERSVNQAVAYAREAVGIQHDGTGGASHDSAAAIAAGSNEASQEPSHLEPRASETPAPAATTWIGRIIAAGFSITVSFILFLTIYCVVPNTRVTIGAASVGATFTAALWELAKQAFALYVSSSKGYANLYGALALLPMFLIWVYLTWIIVLFGLHVAHAMQVYRTATKQGLTRSVLVALGLMVEQHAAPAPIRSLDPASLVLAMTAVGERFLAGKPADQTDVAQYTGLDEIFVVQLLESLVGAGFLHRVNGRGDEPAFALARPPSAILLSEVLSLADEKDPAERVKSQAAVRLIEHLSKARLEAVSGRTLADALA
jgi:membrane protein